MGAVSTTTPGSSFTLTKLSSQCTTKVAHAPHFSGRVASVGRVDRCLRESSFRGDLVVCCFARQALAVFSARMAGGVNADNGAGTLCVLRTARVVPFFQPP